MGKEIQYTSVKLSDEDGSELEPMDVKTTQQVRPASGSSWVRSALWWTLLLAPYLALAVVLIAPLSEGNGEFCAAQRLEKLDMKRNVFYDESVVSEKSRFAAIGQKGATIWMTGLSGSGKSTIGRALEAKLIHDRIQVYRLDGDNVRIGLNRDLGFSASDRQESVRRVGEMAALFAQSGTITIVGLVSPYRAHRDDVRDIHKKMNIPFYEVFVDTPLSVVMARDIKGLYKKAVSGEIKDFTGVSAPYEAPLQADLTLFTPNSTLEAEVDAVYSFLKQKGLLTGVDALPSGYPGVAVADGGNAAAHFDVLYPSNVTASTNPAVAAPRVLLRDEDLHWVQVLGEGWASPLRGFMREGAYLQCLHFSSVVFDADNLTAGSLNPHGTTNFSEYSTADVGRGSRVNMPIPIVLPVTTATKAAIAAAVDSGVNHVVLVSRAGDEVALLSNPEVYDHRKEERITRTFGAYDKGHPYVEMIERSGEFLLGGEIQLLERVTYKDGLDKFRLTPSELRAQFEALGADAVLAFQTRNPTHAGHAYLMNQGRQWLLDQGFKKPVLWLSPLGGWTKDDDVPLDVRVHQHEAIIRDGMLDPASTVMSIWPSPMVYAGPREVQWHAKSRKNAGASYFVVGRDPAGIKRSDQPDEDTYAGDHGRYVLHLAPGMEDMNLLSFPKVYYDKTDHKMKPMTDKTRKRDFLSISGSKMRHMAKMGFQPCENGAIPDTWEADPTCVPPGFMVQSGWNLMIQYYQRMADPSYLQYSIPFRPFTSSSTAAVASSGDSAVIGTLGFELSVLDAATGAKVSPWHDVPLYVNASVVNFVVEIEKGRMEKMEVNKQLPFNPIKQDVTKSNRSRYYLYGVPFFNYGMLPQTWEDPSTKDAAGHGGDNDPLDVIEIGAATLPMGSVNPVKVLGSLELIDQGEVDHKIVALSIHDPLASVVHTVDDLLVHRPHVVDQLVDWLKNYKIPEGKPVNVLSQDTMTSAAEAVAIVDATHARWQALKSGEIPNPGFWLGPSP